MSCVLITGCNGLVGRYVTNALLAAGHRVLGVSLEDASPTSGANFSYFQLDVTHYGAVERLLASNAFDSIVHLAALVHVRHKNYGFADYTRVNYRASENLFRAAATRGGRIVFASTIEVYGPTAQNQAVTEAAPCNPDSDYARSKLLAEESLSRLAEASAVSYAILRFAPVYAGDFTLNLDKRLYLRKPIGYYVAGGDYQLALCSVHNIAHFVVRWLASERPTTGIFNIADASSYPIKELLQRERRAGRCVATMRLPYLPCLAAIATLETTYAILGRETGAVTTKNLRKLVRSTTWDTRRATVAVGTLPWTIDNTPGFA